MRKRSKGRGRDGEGACGVGRGVQGRASDLTRETPSFFFYYLTAAYIQFPTPPPLLILTVHIGTAAISIFDCVRSRGLGLKLHSLHFMFVDEE